LRYIGSKRLLLDEINLIIKENIFLKNIVFADIFSGSSVVARHFKSEYEIITNDKLYFSYTLQKATLENNTVPTFKKLNDFLKIRDVFYYLEKTEIDESNLESFFVYKHYSPNVKCNRMYFTNEIAKRIDYIRITIEKWKLEKLISSKEYFYLLASLIETVPFYSNISGTYGAYLKHWDRRVLKDFSLSRIEVIDNKKKNKSYNEDANQLISHIQGDILYVDPPYNSRQYLPNYHILETIAKYDNPDITGITGIRTYSEQERSLYCKKNFALQTMEDLINKANFKFIIFSYNSEGIITEKQFEHLLSKYAKQGTFIKKVIPYTKYKGKLDHVSEKPLYELLYLIEKK
jgi:adenine-specific DNA-methyltransferase